MANLTHSERVVRRISDLNPIAGHALVIFDQRQGHKFVRVVLDGEFYRPPRTWPFLPGRYYVAYAINTHPNLRLRFSDRFIHHNQVDSYDLNFTVDYHIDNDRERLRAIAVAFSADPLSQLRREIKRIFGSDVASLEWEWIRNDFTSDRWTEGSPALEELASLHKTWASLSTE